MANKLLFSSSRGPLAPRTDTVNEAGGPAYALDDKHALAQYVSTGCFQATFYATAEAQFEAVRALAMKVQPSFLAKLAVHARQHGHMKDMPAFLCAVLSVRDPALLDLVFDRVIDDARMLRSFVQMVRSGAVSRKSLGTRPKKLVTRWLDARSDRALVHASVGNAPSLSDVIKLAHPKPATPARAALYGYLLGKQTDQALLPELVQQFEAFKQDTSLAVPDVPFQMLSALALDRRVWSEIAKNGSWQMLRMNLNTFVRHDVFSDASLTAHVANKLRDPPEVRRARALPYQLLVTHQNIGPDVPRSIRDALHDALEVATETVPALEGKVYVCTDVSGSMSCPVTGAKKGATTKVRCIDVAALVAAALLRKNPDLTVLPFDTDLRTVEVTAKDSVLRNAQRLAAVGGGGTDLSVPLRELNRRKAHGDLVMYVSDNESWVQTGHANQGTATMHEWQKFKERNPDAKLICLDIQPYAHTQAAERPDVLNVGGFSDQVFEVIRGFASGTGAAHWVEQIEQVVLAS